jgi:hypothetical protein
MSSPISRLVLTVIALAGACAAHAAPAASKPSWYSEDTKTKDGFTFYCQGDQSGEAEAMKLAESDCARKMCMLFGVEVKYEQTSTETLTDAKIDSVIKEKCPDVRIVGRTTKKKSVECEEKSCSAFISQFYPIDEYLKEKKRLDNPPIAPALEKTIVIREGNESFKDPKDCRKTLSEFNRKTGVTKEARAQRVTLLKKAKTDCAKLDYRNSNLQSELNGYLYGNITKRGPSFAQMTMQAMPTLESLEARIDYLRSFDEGIDVDKALARAKKLVSDSYSSLFYKDGGLEAYMAEQKSCKAHSKVIRAWPKAFSDDITVCVKDAKSEDCKTTSILFLRAAYAGCVCNLGDPSRAQSCTANLMTLMNTDCPTEMTESCFRSMSEQITESMKENLH